MESYILVIQVFYARATPDHVMLSLQMSDGDSAMDVDSDLSLYCSTQMESGLCKPGMQVPVMTSEVVVMTSSQSRDDQGSYASGEEPMVELELDQDPETDLEAIVSIRIPLHD